MDPILFIPGIKGSELFEEENKRWFPKNLEDLASLKITNNLEAKNPLRGINAFRLINLRIYAGILDNFSPEEIEYFTYDWRRSLFDHVDSLVKHIVRMANESGKVNILAHSMGGMLAKLAILQLEKFGLTEKVNKFITVGTPWHGAPDSYKVLEYGEAGFYQELGSIMQVFSDKKTRELARQCPSVYQLLPSKIFYDSKHGNFLIDDDNSIYPYSEVIKNAQNFFNAVYFDDDENNEKNAPNVYELYMKPLHEEMEKPIPDAIKHYCLVGCEIPTLQKITQGIGQERKKFKKASIFKNGDGTVPVPAALPNHKAQVFFVEGQHRNLCSNKHVINFIKWCIGNGEEDKIPKGITYKSETDDNEELRSGALAKFLCPIDTTIYDEDGKYIAGAFDTNISEISPKANSDKMFYYSIGESKYLYFSEDDKEDITVQINSYSTGVADISVQLLNGDEVTEVNYVPLPVNKGISAKVKIPLASKEEEEFELTTSNERTLAKVRKKNKKDLNADFDVPELKIIIQNTEESTKMPHRAVYSGNVKLTIKTDSDKIENIYYTINNESPKRYREPVELDLNNGEYIVHSFGKDIIGRPTKTVNSKFSIDKSCPETHAHLTITPEGLRIIFDPVTNGSKAVTKYKITHIIKTATNVEETVLVDWLEAPTQKEEIPVPIFNLTHAPNSYYNIVYHSLNSFGQEEEIKTINLSLSNIPAIMWDELSSYVTPEMIWGNLFRESAFPISDFNVLLIGKGYTPSTFSETIKDNVKGVRFVNEQITADVMYAEKYSLYFSGPPNEVLEVGQVYKFKFELITERTKDRIINTNPVAKLHPVKSKLNDIPLKVTQDEDGIFYSEFTVDKTFEKYKYKLLISDNKNQDPPLRDITFIMKDQS